MPRKPLIRQAQYPYHIVNRSRNKEWYQLDMPRMWAIFLNALERAQKKYPVNIHAFVLMENHYHLVLTTPQSDIDKFMMVFAKRFSDQVRFYSDRINQIFGGRYRWSIVDNQTYYKNILRYVFQNPVRSGLSTRCENYLFSSLLLRSPQVQLTPLCNYSNKSFLTFINLERQLIDERPFISKGLQKPIFKLKQVQR